MKNIKPDALQVLAEVCMEENDYDVARSFKQIKLIDDLLGIQRNKSLINHSKGRRTNVEKRFNEVFRARLLMSASEKN